jgi:hypothetical protein
MCYQQQPVHEEDYKGFTIKIHQDQDSGSLNPYENNDGMYPMMVDGGRHDRYDYLDASAAFYPTTNQYRRHKKALMELLNVSQGEGDTANDTENAVTEAIGDAIREHDYDTLEAVGKILGVPCLNTSSIGYSQGDYMDLLVVWTPEFAKTTGVEKKDATYESMEANAKEYGAWAWNDTSGSPLRTRTATRSKMDPVGGSSKPRRTRPRKCTLCRRHVQPSMHTLSTPRPRSRRSAPRP